LLLASLFFVWTPAASARVHHNDAWARAQLLRAERMREALNGRPMGERTRHEYQRVIDAYRRVYFGSPASSKADPSVVATAELLVEMGRRFDDDKILRGAVEEYRFLRKEYPGSKYRFEALFTIAEIYKDDLNDAGEARRTFEDFVHRYPRNRLAEDARAAVKEIDDAAEARERTARKNGRGGKKETARAAARDRNAASGGGSMGASGGPLYGPAKLAAGGVAKGGSNAASKEAASKDTPKELGNGNGREEADESARESASSELNEAGNAGTRSAAETSGARRDELPRVTGVRHWSTPNYTRVAIDVEREVKFDSQRISNPDRIFFDLRDTRLASTLVGKTFDVDDGFLKKIRVAEFNAGRTRVVLEVDDLSSYDAFLLPDPYRLIIDIHGRQSRATMLAKAHEQENGGDTSPGGAANAVAGAADDDAEDLATDIAPGQKVQRKKEKEHAIVAKAAPEDADDGSAGETREAATASDAAHSRTGAKSADRNPRDAEGSSGVTKTTVAVKGSNQRIPKTIVEADDDRAPLRHNGDKQRGQSPATTTRKGPAVKDAPGRGHAGDDTADLETREARPTASGDRSLTRALGLKIGKIVIDAGHGGHDTGTIGPHGLYEKDVVLDVARRLGRLLEVRLGAEVVYTRRDDTFIPLETRTAIANREQADLFISIHANSSHDPDARGVETYYLNFTSSPEALEVAARENAVSEKSIHELQDLVKKIALKEKIDESREFASDVQDSLFDGLTLNNAGIRNRGVKKAPFIVLIGANMPSILAEISFVSNPTDERKLETSEQRQRISESLYRGVAKYAGGLSGVKVASKIDKTQGQ